MVETGWSVSTQGTNVMRWQTLIAASRLLT